jgi:hypothetical protein
MRNLAFSVLVVATVSAGIGCGGGSTRKVDGGAGATGSAGSTAGTTGTAGTGAAGSTAGTTGTGGDTGVAGAGGSAAGAGGTAAGGTGGTGGTGGEPPPPPPPYCDMAGMVKKALPYKIDGDFSYVDVLQNNAQPTFMQWKVVANPNCDVDPTTLPALYTPPVVEPGLDAGVDGAADGGADAGTDAATDAAADTSTLALDPDAGDGGVDAAADTAVDVPVDSPVDSPVDAPADGGSDALADGGSDGPKAPACYEFTYVPDPCVASGGTCWGGAILEPVANAGAHATGPGICIGDGAMNISFMAKGSRAGARIKWGSIREGLDSTEHFLTTLTKDWVKYTITIPAGELYNTTATPGGVWNGFSVVGEPADHMGGTYIFVKDITWSAN